MAHKPIDITPDPKVLVALTRTPILPIDALSELIDNAVDSFRTAATSGSPAAVRQVIIEVPGSAEVARGEGMIRVRDTGPGLTEEQIADSMRASTTLPRTTTTPWACSAWDSTSPPESSGASHG